MDLDTKEFSQFLRDADAMGVRQNSQSVRWTKGQNVNKASSPETSTMSLFEGYLDRCSADTRSNP